MARIFGRDSTTDIRERDDIEVVPDRDSDPVVIDSETTAENRALFRDPAMRDRLLDDPAVRERLLDDPEVRATLLADPAVRDQVFEDPDLRDRLLEDPDVRTRVFDQPEVQRRLAGDVAATDTVVHERVSRRRISLGNPPATAGFVLGLVAIAVGLVPVLFPAAIGFGVVGLIRALVGRKRSGLLDDGTDARRKGGVTSLLGVLLCLGGIALGVVGLLIVADVINGFDSTIADVVEELRDADEKLGTFFN